MELNRAESAAVAAVGGVPADVLDMAGRLVVTPNALTLDGQRNVPADLKPGESLASFLNRHVPGIGSGAWTVMIGGAMVPQAMWARTFPKHGQLIACRAVVRRSALQLVALAALTYFSGGIAAGIYGAAGGTYVAAAAGTWLSAIQAGVFIAGSVLINKVLGPKIPSAQSLAQKQVYSLSDQRNTARPYEPIPVLWGEMRVTPDLASKAYAWYEGDDQYLSTILLGGINVHSAADLTIGETPIGNYSDVSIYYNGFAGMPSQDVPLYSNVDAVAGADLVNGGDWVTRTGSAGAGVLQLDIEGQLYDVDNKGNIKPNSVDLTIEARLVGSSAWATLASSTITNASTDVLRRTHSFDVAPGQYEVRAKLGVPRWNEGGSADACKFTWVSLKSVQADTTDYSQWGRIGIKIRASGQLSGSLDQVRATYRAKPMPIWTGTEWATATTRADGLSNPGAILLQTLRGVWVTDRQGQRVLQFGFGLSDEQIDIEGLKAFMLHCAARGYTYDKWVTSSMSLGAFCEEVALAGMGEFAWTDGSRPTAVFVTNGQPNSAVVNMANMLKGGFSVDYALSNAADGIEYQWLNRDTWEMTTLRVMAPGVTTMLSPARVTGEGITSEQHAAVMARYHLAQSLYQYKTVHFTADIEHLDYRRLSVLSVSHDLTQWGFGGRVMAAQRIGAQVRLTLDEVVPPLASAYIGLRVPGARDYRVWPVQPLAAESDVVTLVGEWPEDLDFPGEGIGNPAHDTLWCYDFKATPGYRVRVTGIDPESDLKGARVTAVPEGPEFWDYVLNGTYVPAPNQSSIPQLGRPVVKNLRVTEKVNLQGDTEWYELSCVWDVEGDCDHAQVWAGRDGSELRMVDGNAQGARSTFRIDGAGEWLIVVRPFNANGQSGQSATLLYITTMTQLPPRNPGTFVVQQVEGGLRRFAWMYAGERPAAFAGVQIRYLPGDVPLSVADWDAMQPLGTADDVYTAQFVTTKPDAGQWTFGLRAVDTAGQLATGVMRFSVGLDKVFENIREPDLTPPPAPTGVTAAPLMTTAQVNWASPTYTVGHGHDHSVIYAAPWAAGGAAPAFSAAKSVGTEQGHPASIPVELGTKYTIWVTHVSVDGVESLPSAGVTFETAQDVGKLLDVLEGKITESQLYTDLAKEIDLISGTGAGSVNARVLAEAQARAQAVAAEATTRAQAVANEAAARGQDMAAMAAELDAAANDLQARIDAVNAQVSDIIGASEFDPDQAYEAGRLAKYQNKLYRAKVNTVGNLPTNATYWDLVGDYASLGEAVAAHAAQLADHSNRITQTEQGLTAEASARTTLAAQLRGSYTGTDVALVTTGLVWSERQARVSGDSANASAIDAVKARMPTGTGKVASEASVIDEATARAAADAAAASRTTAIEARLPAGTGSLATASAVTALDTRVTAAEGSLTNQSGQITSLQNSLAEAGGQNLLYNPSFDLEGSVSGIAAGFANVRSSGVAATPSLVPSWIDPAGRAQRLDSTGLTTSLYSDIQTDNNFRTSAVEGQRVALSAYVRASAGLTVRLHIQARTSQTSGTLLATYNGPVVTPGESGVRITLLSTALPAGTTALNIIFRLLGSATTSAGWVEWDRAQVELGATVTGWSDNSLARDAATSAAVSALTSRVTAAEGVNTSQSTNITNLQNSVTGLQSSKADASALTALDSKVTGQGNTLTSQGTAITALQNSITNGPVLPSDFSAGLSNWTGSRQGDPTQVNTLAGTIVTDDADFGVCAQFNNWTTLGTSALSKGLVQAIPGRVYRVRARFKVLASPTFPIGMNIVAGGNTATYTAGGDAFGNPVTVSAAGQIVEITALFSDKAANAAGAVAWGATAVLLRFGLRLNTALTTGLQLRVQSIAIEEATADVANADATTALTSRVSAAEGNISSTSGALTTLTNRVTAAEGVNASQATAISGLQTSVTNINGTLTSQGSSITSLSNSLDALQGAGDNLLKASNVELVRAAGAYKIGSYIPAEALIRGEYYTLVACITHTPASGDTTSSVGAWVNGQQGITTNLVRNGNKVIATYTFGFNHATAPGTSVDFYYYPSTVTSGAATVHWACLYQGTVVPPKAWQPSVAELGQAVQGKADASAVSSLQSTVSQQGNTITSQGTSLAALKNTVENPTTGLGSKASSSALTALDSKVTGIDGRLTAETSRIDTLQVSVSEAGGQNLLYNPSFEVAGTGGFADGYVRGGQSAGVATTPSLVVSWLDPLGRAQRLDCTGLGTSLYSDIVNINNFKPAAVEGQRAAFSTYVRASAGISVRIYVQARTSQTVTATLATYTGTLETPGEGGARISLVTPVLPAGTTALHLLFRVLGSGSVSAGFVEWDRAQVELGTTVTAWRDNGVAGLSAVNAAVNTLATASANADAALASRATALEARMPTGTGQLATAAALTAVDTKVTNIDGRVTSESTRLDQVQATVGSAAACLQALNPLGGESEWSAVGGAAAATFVTGAEPDARGGAVLTVGNATVSGERWLRHVAAIPMDENKLYKLSARFRRTAGDGGIYLGIAGLNAAKTLYVTTNNTETSSISSAHYATNNVKPALGTWQVVEYYFKGRSAGAATGSGTKAAPRVFANKVAHLALMIVGNYQGQVGFFDLDYITLEDVTADEQALAAIATEASTRATTDGYLGAQYSVRMQLSQGGQQVVGGFGISGTTSGTAGPQIDFGVMANSFWIAAPSGSPGGVSNVKPFSVQTTSQTVNGQVIPAGVYMDAAYINNVTALWARFGNLVADTIQATSISVSKLTGGKLSVGSWINSSNYVAGSTGWSINSDGQAEFCQVTVRGAIYSTVGTIGGIAINGSGLNSGGFWGYAWPPAGQSGFHLGPNGILLGNANNGRYVEIQSSGNIYAPGLRIENGNATFSGNLSGASGSFSGILTAQRVVTTDNLEPNSASTPLFTQSASASTSFTTPAFDSSMTCVVHYGGSFNFVNQRGDFVYLTLYVDGGAVQSIVIGALNNPGCGSFAFSFTGNGIGRGLEVRMTAAYPPTGNVFLQATIHKR